MLHQKNQYDTISHLQITTPSVCICELTIHNIIRIAIYDIAAFMATCYFYFYRSYAPCLYTHIVIILFDNTTKTVSKRNNLS